MKKNEKQSVILSGEFVRDQRKALGLSQTDVSNKTGIPQSCISKFEAGSQTMQFPDYFKLLNALKIGVTVTFEFKS